MTDPTPETRSETLPEDHPDSGRSGQTSSWLTHTLLVPMNIPQNGVSPAH